MKQSLTSAFVVLVLLAAAAPWLLSSCQPGSLVPPELRDERTAYEATVAAAREATAQAQRRVQSTVVVLPARQLQPLPAATATPTLQPVSGVTIFTVTPMGSLAALPATETPQPATITSAPTETQLQTIVVSSGGGPATPAGMVDVEDRLSEAQLEAQAREEEDAGDLSDIQIAITSEGILVTAKVKLIAGIRQPLQARGNFAVEDTNLVVNITQIKLEKRDVTVLYQDMVESIIVTSLYNLLPQRYVQSFTALPGEVVVQSKVRP